MTPRVLFIQKNKYFVLEILRLGGLTPWWVPMVGGLTPWCLWFSNNNNANHFQLSAAKLDMGGSFGVTDWQSRQVFVFVESFGAIKVNEKQAETTVHEIGHVWHLINNVYPHVDDRLGRFNHINSDKCVMSYDRIRDDGIAEFCIECLLSIRDRQSF